MTKEDFIKKYIYGVDNDALTDNQEAIDMAKDLDRYFAEQLRQYNVGGAKRKLVCPHCKSGEENFTRNGHHIWCRKCDYEFNVV